MDAITSHTGLVLPIDSANIDTDAILPKQYLKCIRKFGYGDWLFDDFRYLDPGEVETDTSTRRPNPDYVLNKPVYRGASVLLARENFGCGSSREHAVWALRDYGIRAVIAPSYADIFFNNCFKNAILPLTLSHEEVDELFRQCEGESAITLTVDLEASEVRSEDGRIYPFTVDENRRQRLLSGQDDIAHSLENADKIRQFEASLRQREPWLFR